MDCEIRVIAALYVAKGGCYYGLPDVDPWDQERDARMYPGPWPVVAHPPCPRWGKMYFGQPLTVKRTGERKRKGDDEGCFKCAKHDVEAYGGVLEHPEGSHAWKFFGLNEPPREGGWIEAGEGWTCCVEQGRYGHYARKPTWLYVVGVERDDLPELDWGIGEPRYDPDLIASKGLAWVKKLGEVGAKGGGTDSKPRISTPIPFRDLLLSIARKVNRRQIEPLLSYTATTEALCPA
jgi:hypothetical protein